MDLSLPDHPNGRDRQAATTLTLGPADAPDTLFDRRVTLKTCSTVRPCVGFHRW